MPREKREFTGDEIARINAIKAGNMENLSADDVQLYSDWQTEWALRDAEMQAELDAIQSELDAKLDMYASEHERAMQNMANLQAAALARLARIEGGAND